MQKRNFGNLARTGSAGAANSGTLTDTAQKDRVVYLDPNTEIIYDPSLNVRNDPIKDDMAGLIELRQTIDVEEQMQPIRVYPLTPELLKKYGRKPGEKLYGIAIGHRRYLSCRLTSKDHPSLGPHSRKVMALIDTTWLSKSASEKLLYMLHENKKRKGLSHVEYGETIKRYQKEKSQELGRHVNQRELQDTFSETAKTIGYLLQAADFEPAIKELCRASLLSDLDALVTLDGIAKKNLPFAEAICESLQDQDAPRNRALIREAKSLLDADPDYVVDKSAWVWPETVRAHPANQRNKPPKVEPEAPTVSGAVAPSLTGSVVEAGGEAGSYTAPTPAGGAVNTGREQEPHPQTTVSTGSSEHQEGSSEVSAPPSEVTGTPPASPATGGTAQPPANESNRTQQTDSNTPVVMVSFKMHADAGRTFNGELLLHEAAKHTNLGVVAYLEDGKEKRIQVPLNLIQLLSIGY